MRISPEFSAHIKKTRTVNGASLVYLTMLFCERPDGPIKLEVHAWNEISLFTGRDLVFLLQFPFIAILSQKISQPLN